MSKSYTPLKKLFLQSRNFGYTLIELLIVIASMALILTVGFAGFRGSQKRQELSNAVLYMKGELRFAQEQSLAGRKPAGCNNLNGYILDSTAANKYRIKANCDSNVTITLTELSEKTITDKFPGVSLPVFTDVFFNVLGRGVKTTANIVITLSNSSGSKTITVTQGGEIN
jgi:type II secretory pathway pseudopilin PulG